ncbi:MAG TPA: hypothetical protein VEG63_00240, partial [Candidatus Acidoferrales bacterium]|nr:hypothetical protein [Candidatus Acidoferrales bacterium]
LPLTHAGADPEMASFADGLAEDIIAGLAKFPYLSVISRNSTLRFKGQTGDVRSVGQQLGARYVLEGGIRKGASTLRINMQLIDTQSGAHLWAETYNRELKDRDIFAVQDDITDHVVATVGDSYGALVRSMAASVEGKREEELTASDWVLRHYRYRQFISPEEHAPVRDGLERFVEREPKHASVWAALAQMYVHEFCLGYNTRPEPLERALAAARRAVHLDLTNQHGREMLAFVHFFRGDIAAFRTTAEQAMEMNPRDTDTLGAMGLLFMYSGEFERGTNLVRRAMDLNPHHADWMHFALMWEHFQKGDYEKALAQVTRMSMPGLYWQPLSVAVCCGLLGRKAEAAIAVEELLKLDKDFEQHTKVLVGSWLQLSGLQDRFYEGMRKAGLRIPEPGEAASAAGPAEVTSASVAESLPSSSKQASGAMRAQEGFWVAVLPFQYTGKNENLRALAEGLSEEVITGLSRFSYLRVIARGSTAKYSSESGDVRAIGKELGARYVMEGSLRQAGSKLRVAVQLVDTVTGAHLWAEKYERAFTPESVFEIQDDLVPSIVATVADHYGVLPRSMSEVVRSKSEDTLTPHEAVLRTFSFFGRISPEEHAALRRILERAVREFPDHADSWAMLSMIYRGEFSYGYNARPNPLDRALDAAQRAVTLAPANALGHCALATVFFFRKEMTDFRAAAERALGLNPLDAFLMAYLGHLIASSGEWDRGCRMVESAMKLNPNYPGWLHIPLFANAYRQGKYEEALEAGARMNEPGYFHTHSLRAMAFGQLGRREEARKAVQDLLALRPDFAAVARREYAKWYQPELVEHLLEGLRKAGLDVSEAQAPAVAEPSLSSAGLRHKTDSGATRAAEGFWVAVLPFKSRGEASLEALAEGFTEEIITGLSRFSYLRVIARGSTAKYSSESGDVRAIGKELGARYVMEGSIRQAGATARVAVQLVDATTGTHLWAETFERAFGPEQAFALQDELVPRIVSTVADQHGILVRSIAAAIRKKGDAQLNPYEAVFRVFSLHEQMTAQGHAACRDVLERVVKEAPDEGDCWAMLATLYSDEDWFGFNLQPDPLGRALAAAQRAVELAPASALASQAMAQSLFMRREWQAFRPVAERTIALNPMDGAIVAIMGILLACSGDWKRGCAVADSAMKLHPNFPGWYWLAKVFDAYRTRDYRAAIDAALRIQMPEYFWTPTALAAAYGQLGESEAAQKALKELLSIRPDFAGGARRELEKWFEPELVEHFLEGLRKAGLKAADAAK